MPYGPIELLVLEFPGNEFSGEITPALAELVDSGTIRIIDILFVQKDADGNVIESELSDLTESDFAVFDPVIDELAGLLTHEDALYLTSALAPNSSAGIMLFENVWARRFTDAVVQANGRLIVNERIPRAVIEELVAAHAEPEPIA
jgi:hypothetical protein